MKQFAISSVTANLPPARKNSRLRLANKGNFAEAPCFGAVDG